MARPILVSYDGTPNDDDALALGRLLAGAGAPLALAYVRHSREFDPRREELAEHDAQRRLSQGAQWLGDEEIPQHVVISASTWEGLAKLAAEIDASDDRIRLRLPHRPGQRRPRHDRAAPARGRRRAGRGRAGGNPHLA